MARVALLAFLFAPTVGSGGESRGRAALRLACPGQTHLAGLFDAASSSSGVRVEVLVTLFRRESSCDPGAVNRRTRSYGALQLKVDGSANRPRSSPAQLLDPARNVSKGARHLARLLRLCRRLGGALTLYHGRRGAYHGRGRCDVDDYALELVAAARILRRMIDGETRRRDAD